MIESPVHEVAPEVVTLPEGIDVAANTTRSSQGISTILYPGSALALILIAWEAWVRITHVPLYLIPAPSQAVEAMFTRSPLLLSQAVVTGEEIVLGFTLSVLIGIPISLGIVSWRPFEKAVFPLLVTSQVVPKLAVAPLLLIWLGFGIESKVLIAFMISFFPIVIDSVIGLRSVEIEKLYLAQSMGATRMQTFFKIRLPNAMPSIFGGLKLGATFSVIGAVVGEFVGADAGLGRVLLVANGNLDTVLLFAATGYLTIIGITIFLLMDTLERIVLPWHVSHRADQMRSV